VEEWITAIVSVTSRPWNTYGARGQGQAMHYDCSAYSVLAMRAPQGQLTDRKKFFRMILQTMQVNPTWNAQANGVALNIGRSSRKALPTATPSSRRAAKTPTGSLKRVMKAARKLRTTTPPNYTQGQRDLETYRNPATGETVE